MAVHSRSLAAAMTSVHSPLRPGLGCGCVKGKLLSLSELYPGEHLVRGRRGDSPGADCRRRTRNSPPTPRRRRAAATTEAACSYRSAGIVRSVDAQEMAAFREGPAQDRYVAADLWRPNLFTLFPLRPPLSCHERHPHG